MLFDFDVSVVVYYLLFSVLGENVQSSWLVSSE